MDDDKKPNGQEPDGGDKTPKENEDELDEGLEEDEEELEKLEQELLDMDDAELEDNPELVKDVQEKLKSVKITIQQKRHWRTKAKKLEEGKKEAKPADKKPEAQAPAADASAQNTERNDFRFDHPELKTSEVQEIERYARANGLTLEATMKRPLIQTWLEKKKGKDEALDASPSSKTRGVPSKPAKDWSKATKAELDAERSRIAREGK